MSNAAKKTPTLCTRSPSTWINAALTFKSLFNLLFDFFNIASVSSLPWLPHPLLCNSLFSECSLLWLFDGLLWLPWLPPWEWECPWCPCPAPWRVAPILKINQLLINFQRLKLWANCANMNVAHPTNMLASLPTFLNMFKSVDIVSIFCMFLCWCSWTWSPTVLPT